MITFHSQALEYFQPQKEGNLAICDKVDKSLSEQTLSIKERVRVALLAPLSGSPPVSLQSQESSTQLGMGTDQVLTAFQTPDYGLEFIIDNSLDHIKNLSPVITLQMPHSYCNVFCVLAHSHSSSN